MALLARHQLTDHRVAPALTDHQQVAGGARVTEQQQLLLVDRRREVRADLLQVSPGSLTDVTIIDRLAGSVPDRHRGGAQHLRDATGTDQRGPDLISTEISANCVVLLIANESGASNRAGRRAQTCGQGIPACRRPAPTLRTSSPTIAKPARARSRPTGGSSTSRSPEQGPADNLTGPPGPKPRGSVGARCTLSTPGTGCEEPAHCPPREGCEPRSQRARRAARERAPENVPGRRRHVRIP